MENERTAIEECDLAVLRTENSRLQRRIEELELRLALQTAAARIVGMSLRQGEDRQHLRR